MAATENGIEVVPNDGKQRGLLTNKYFDDVVAETGGFGRYQIGVSIAYGFPKLFVGYLTMSLFFSYTSTDYRCVHQKCTNNSNIAGKVNKFYKCHLFNSSSNCSNHTERKMTSSEQITSYVHNNITSYTSHNYEKCREWVYDDTDFDSTIISHFNLVCDDSGIASHAKTCYFIGSFIGSLIISFFSDKYGRRFALQISLILVSSSCLGISLSTHHYVIMILLVLNGAGACAMIFSTLVMTMEIIPPDKRFKPGVLFWLCFDIGYVSGIWSAYFSRTWWIAYVVTSVLTFLLLLITPWFPESPRWMLSKGYVKKAEYEVRRMARYNGVTLPSGFSLETIAREKNTPSMWREVIRSRKLRKNAAIIWTIWFVITLSLFGLSIQSVSMLGNRFLNTFIIHSADLGRYLIVYFFAAYFDRSKFACVTTISGGLSLLTTTLPIFIGAQTSGSQYGVVVLILFGRLALETVALTVVYTSPEIFPTPCRNFIFGIGTAGTRVAALISPYIADIPVYIDTEFGQAIPLIIFGASTFAVGLLALKLPNVANQRLPETVQDCEMIGRNTNRKKSPH